METRKHFMKSHIIISARVLDIIFINPLHQPEILPTD